MQDITSIIQKQESEKLNIGMSTQKMFFKPKSITKRSFTTMEFEETITMKRARKYLGSDDDDDNDDNEVMQSPFFSKNGGTAIVEQMVSLEVMEKTVPEENEELIEENVEENEVELGEEIVETKERQVSESPPRKKTVDAVETNEYEVIPDSPTGPTRVNPLDPNITTKEHTIIRTSPPTKFTNPSIFPPSPPPSRQNLPHAIHVRPSNQTPKMILHPGLKKPYTPKPSHQAFPETPTPVNHSIIVQGWKDRFTSKFTNTTLCRPMTPLRTPILKRKCIPSNSNSTGISGLGKRVGMVEEIEEISPPRGRAACLDQFRFTPQ